MITDHPPGDTGPNMDPNTDPNADPNPLPSALMERDANSLLPWVFPFIDFGAYFATFWPRKDYLVMEAARIAAGEAHVTFIKDVCQDICKIPTHPILGKVNIRRSRTLGSECLWLESSLLGIVKLMMETRGVAIIDAGQKVDCVHPSVSKGVEKKNQRS